MKKTPIQILRDLVDVHSVATELVDDNRFEELAAEYISHDAPTMPELREKVMDQAKRVLEDAEPNLAPRWEDAPPLGRLAGAGLQRRVVLVREQAKGKPPWRGLDLILR